MDKRSAESVAPPAAHGSPSGARSPTVHRDFDHDEINAVLARYELGAVHRIEDLRAGSELSPKAVVESERGKMLLKRRARGLDIPVVVAFAHEVLCGCLRGGVCVPPLVGTKDTNSSLVQMNDHVYELFVFIEGTGYTKTRGQARQTGALLGEVHAVMDTLEIGFEPSFEPAVVDPARAARLAPTEGFDRGSIDRAGKILSYGADLARANAEAGKLVHGDWHPGNMIYQGDEIVAVCDFDNTRIGSRSRELAQGLVYFSMRPDAVEPDPALLRAFWEGHASQGVAQSDPRVIASLMPAVLLDEGFAPVNPAQLTEHAPMLAAVLKRAVWMEEHHDQLVGMLAS